MASATTSCAGALMLVVVCASISFAVDSKRASWNKSAALKEAGYVELSAEEAVHLLVGNSVLVTNSGPLDGEKGGVGIRAKIYYFVNDHLMYECGVATDSDCFVQSWRLKDNEICFASDSCREPSKILRSPHPEDRTRRNGRIGVYVWFDHFVYDIVAGNRTVAPLFDPHVSGHPIEIDRADIDQATRRLSDDDKWTEWLARRRGDAKRADEERIPISSPRAAALLIGNTFLSDDVSRQGDGQPANACPKRGVYYSPDGHAFGFTCDGAPDDPVWTIFMSHWKVEGDMFCGRFSCSRTPLMAVPALKQSGSDRKMLVHNIDSGNALIGYAGNALAFRFESHPKSEKSKKSGN